MRFIETRLPGAFVIEIEPHVDERGFFARTFCEDEFAKMGLDARVSQRSVSFNPRRGTLRGLHFQAPPHQEVKLVRCLRGAIFDVIVDLRSDSKTYLQWVAVELSQDNHQALYIPGGFAHGFITLQDDTEVDYQMNLKQIPSAARGIRWDDPALQISWPFSPLILSERDRTYPDFQPPI